MSGIAPSYRQGRKKGFALTDSQKQCLHRRREKVEKEKEEFLFAKG